LSGRSSSGLDPDAPEPTPHAPFKPRSHQDPGPHNPVAFVDTLVDTFVGSRTISGFVLCSAMVENRARLARFSGSEVGKCLTDSGRSAD
jgi:hypothetical protein